MTRESLYLLHVRLEANQNFTVFFHNAKPLLSNLVKREIEANKKKDAGAVVYFKSPSPGKEVGCLPVLVHFLLFDSAAAHNSEVNSIIISIATQ